MPELNHNERGHAINGPSSLHRRAICPGSRLAEEGRPDISSAAAVEGTTAHELLERCLNEDASVSFPDTEMQSAVMEAFRWVQKWVQLGYNLYVENQVDPSELLGNETWGTADIILIKENHVIVADFKYGKGREVLAEGNEQLLAYAAGVQCSLNIPVKFGTSYTLVILQPRLPSGSTVKTVEFTHDEIIAEWEYLNKVVNATYVYNAARVPEYDACYYCKARLDCKERTEQATNATTEAFAAVLGRPTVEQEATLCLSDMPLTEMSDEHLSELFDMKDVVNSLFKDIGELIEARIRKGCDIPGYKIVQGAKRRKWVFTDDELRKKFKGMKLIMSDYEHVAIKSPAQMENTASVTEKLSDAQQTNLATFWDKIPGADRLVVSSATGVSIVFNSDQAFAEAVEGCVIPDPEPLSFL